MGPMNIALIVVVYIAAVVLLLNPWSRSSQKFRKRKPLASDPFRAVSLVCESESCEEIGVLEGQRLLVNEAPAIPLQQCISEVCGCRYHHHEDRRSHSDRRQTPKRAGGEEGSERRGLRGRRKSDWSLMAVSGL